MATRKSAVASERKDAAPSAEERHRMVSEAAYYIAQSRGFCGDDTMADWLLAERQVEVQLAAAEPQA